MTKSFIFCSSVILIIAFTAPGIADEHFPYLAEVSKESVNVRAGPNTNFEKVDKLNKGSKIIVIGRSYEWLKVLPMPTTKEFIRCDYLKINQGDEIAAVSGDNVNIRSSASSDAASLGEVKKGTLVKILEKAPKSGEDQQSGDAGWCQLSPVAGTAVWIHQDFLNEVSADVPASMMIPQIESHSLITTNVQTSIPIAEKKIVEIITLQGKLSPLSEAPSDDIHYKIVIDDKTSFYLKDIPQMSYFANMVVTVEGTIIPDPHKKLEYPLLHINKIALVL